MTQTRQILVLYAHPNPATSRVQKTLHRAIVGLDGVEVRDLYQLYPHFFIDVRAEQEALLRSDLIIFQHPIYWYSSPALLKEWQDRVLEAGFAYGPEGVALRGKDFLQVISSGGQETAFQRQSGHGFSLSELLKPYEATARLCGLHYHQPLAVQGAARTDERVQELAQNYRQILLNYRTHGRAALDNLDRTTEVSVHE